MKTSHIQIRIDPALKDAAQAVATSRGTDLSDMIRQHLAAIVAEAKANNTPAA